MIFRRTRWVTFPRSGHHWTVRMLRHALPDIVYDEHHSTGKTLENSPELHLQKTHDFDLDVPISTEFRHIVQVRDFVKSMESWQFQRDDMHLQKMELAAMLAFYHAFVLRWVIGGVPNRLIVHYGDLLSCPHSTLSEIIEHVCDLDPGEALKQAKRSVAFEPPKKTE